MVITLSSCPQDCIEHLIMTHRSDRRGDEPMTTLTFRGREFDWLPAREFSMMARSRDGSMDEAEDTTAVRPFVP